MMKRNMGYGGFPSNMPSNTPPNIMPNQIAPIQSMPAQYCPPPPCPPQYCPPQVFPTQYDPGLVDPAQQYVKTNLFNKVVQHIHPSHTTTVNKLHINHQHYFPHTESCVNECCETHTMCGVPVNPCCPPMGPFGF
ncbi:CotD family spore coat protein [Neobacillus cucumis]|uniref:CotD family spore coat protein n=1 Tax=Neobacillus cucumis TaxID=1740721 RepID=UPI00285371EB|nr:CotD family spore coat protein [Neobacillus cucumis]MDR4947906.1 CotD family spore coat protein [Neobacillus cucumis]